MIKKKCPNCIYDLILPAYKYSSMRWFEEEHHGNIRPRCWYWTREWYALSLHCYHVFNLCCHGDEKKRKKMRDCENEKCGRDFNSLALYYVNYDERYLILMMSILWLIVVIRKLHRAFDRDSRSPTLAFAQKKQIKKFSDFNSLLWQ